MQMIIEEIQLRQANYRYTVSTLAFNLVLFFDRLDNENIKFQNNSRETSDYTRKIISYIELDTFSMEHFSFASISQAFLIRTRFRYSDGVILADSIKILRICVSLRLHALAKSFPPMSSI